MLEILNKGEGGVTKKNEERPQVPWLLKGGNKPLDLRSLPRCLATAKSTRKRCGNPAMKGKRVCYIHGGKSPGAPKGNQHALKHGYYMAEAIAERRYMRSLIKRSKDLVAELRY